MSRGRFAAWTVVFCCLALISLSRAVSAQSELRIARPLDGATVRETVNVLVPVSCVPEGGFITCAVDGRFKSAGSAKSQDGRYFVYRWDTKAVETSLETGTELGRARDGRHLIAVRVHDSSGKSVGSEKRITVYVKNNASADMPAGGLKLRYRNKAGIGNKYKFKYSIDLKSIRGATNITASLGEAVEGAEGVIRRSVEDVLPDGTALVRQKLTGMLLTYQGGQVIPAAGIVPKAYYEIEDSLGRIVHVMSSSSPGTAASVDLPNLPAQQVRIGDTWILRDKVFRNAVTGDSVALGGTGALEGLEWEGGHPCAKIRTSFSGTIKLPFSSVLTEPMAVSGETVTYFAYRVGKVISSVTTAVAEPNLSEEIVSNLSRSLLSQTGSQASAVYMPTELLGTPAMEGPRASYTTGAQAGTAGGTDKQTVKVKLQITQSLELVP